MPCLLSRLRTDHLGIPIVNGSRPKATTGKTSADLRFRPARKRRTAFRPSAPGHPCIEDGVECQWPDSKQASPSDAATRPTRGSSGSNSQTGTRCGIEPLAQCLIDRRMVEEIEVVEPPEVARVLDWERDVPAITGLAAGAVRLDEKVAHQSTERVAAARCHSGADRVVIGPRDERNLVGFAL